jgi:hypothetical protein
VRIAHATLAVIFYAVKHAHRKHTVDYRNTLLEFGTVGSEFVWGAVVGDFAEFEAAHMMADLENLADLLFDDLETGGQFPCELGGRYLFTTASILATPQRREITGALAFSFGP